MIAYSIRTYYGKDIKEISRIEILGTINNKITKFLLDTGAIVIVVDRKVIKYKKLEHKNDLYLETVNNSEFKNVKYYYGSDKNRKNSHKSQ